MSTHRDDSQPHSRETQPHQPVASSARDNAFSPRRTNAALHCGDESPVVVLWFAILRGGMRGGPAASVRSCFRLRSAPEMQSLRSVLFRRSTDALVHPERALRHVIEEEEEEEEKEK